MSEIERFAKDAEDMRKAYQSTVEHKGENALCIEKFYLRLWTAAAEALRSEAERSKGCVWCKSDSKVTHNGEHFCFFCSYYGKRLEVEP